MRPATTRVSRRDVLLSPSSAAGTFKAPPHRAL